MATGYSRLAIATLPRPYSASGRAAFSGSSFSYSWRARSASPLCSDTAASEAISGTSRPSISSAASNVLRASGRSRGVVVQMAEQIGPALVLRREPARVLVGRLGGRGDVVHVVAHRELAVGIGQLRVRLVRRGRALDVATRLREGGLDRGLEGAGVDGRQRQQVGRAFATGNSQAERQEQRRRTDRKGSEGPAVTHPRHRIHPSSMAAHVAVQSVGL